MGSRRVCSPTTSTTRPRASPSCCRGSRRGERIALVSDAGLPAISDPGARLVRAARDAGVEVTVLPGPSAVETALVTSGLAGARYLFLGFLPRRAGELAALWRELAAWPWPAVAFESPQRLAKTLRSLAAADPEREVAVCRELTKRFEEVVIGPAAELAERFTGRRQGRGDARLRPGAGRATIRPLRGRRSPSSSPPARPAASPPTSSRG